MSGRPLSILLAVLASVLLAFAAVTAYAQSEFVDADAFSARVASSLEDEAVQEVVADRTVDGLVEAASRDVLAVRPLLATAIEALVGTKPFQTVFALAVQDAHTAILEERASLVLELGRGAGFLTQALGSVSPELDRRLPDGVAPELASLDPADAELGAARTLADLAGFWWAFALGALLLGAASVAVAPERRRAFGRLGAAAAGAAAFVLAAFFVGRQLVVAGAADAAGLSGAREQEAVAAVWDSLLGDLRTAAVLGVVAGLAVAAVAADALEPSDLRDLVRRAAASGRRTPKLLRAARGVALVAAGVLTLLEPAAAVRVVVLAGGALLVFLGVAELSTALERRAARRRARETGDAPLVAAAAAVAVVAVVAAGVALVIPAPGPADATPAVAAKDGCNGARVLCGRRLNEVAFAGTHNSFSAAEEPGWLFANQRYGLERQLRDGIRAFLLDVHPGVRDPASGRVRTDLEREDRSRNRVARELSPEALQTADRLVGRVGLGERQGGQRRLYLCHSLCELGAEPVAAELRAVDRFLDANPGEVVVFFLEPYVPPADLERALRDAGLLERAAELTPGEPLPTLGELVEADRRLVVFTERQGGERPWLLEGFAFVQDTPLGAQEPRELRCARNRGEPESPLLMINHWIDRFPPPPSANARIGGGFLERRLERCARERGLMPNIVATDFYDESGVVDVVRRINARPAGVPPLGAEGDAEPVPPPRTDEGNG